MIAIIDYGMGNLRSVSKAFEAVGHQAVVTRDPRVIGNASHVVLPGVGAFGDCMANVERYGLAEPIRTAIQSGKPFLGICLGLQLLFEESEEFGTHKGLGIIPGKVKRFAADQGLKVPHMGWNNVTIRATLSPVRRDPQRSRTGTLCIRFMSIPLHKTVAATTTDYGFDVCLKYLAEQCGGLSVPSRKESGRRVTVDQKFWILACIAARGSA